MLRFVQQTSQLERFLMAIDNTAPVSVEHVILHAIAPMHKRAFGMAVGITAAILIFLATAFHILVAPGEASDLALLSQYFYGYRVDWPGAFMGAAWAGVVGFVAGFFFAFVRNVVLATWVMSKRVKAELTSARDILDHI